jgi:PAS domain S-box-containing protein
MEVQNVKARFNLDAQERINAIKREIDTNIEVLHNIHSFYEGSEEVTREEFRKFTAHIVTRRPSIRALAWIPRVPLSEKDLYEEAARQRFPAFRITEQDRGGIFIGVKKREEYFPVYFVEPLEGNETSVGFDVFSEPTRGAALKNALESGAMAATARITLLDEQEEQYAFLVFDPIEDRNNNLSGFVLGVFKISDIVESALSYLEPAGINLYLYDLSSSGLDHLYKHSSRLNNYRSGDEIAEVKDRNTYYLEHSFKIADRKWKAVAYPVTAYISDVKDLHAWVASSGIVLLTILVVGYLKKVSDQSVYAEQLIQKLSDEIIVRKEMEAALKDSEQEYRSLFESINEAFAYHKIILDEKNRPVDYEFILVNEGFERATGLTREKVIGRKVTELIPGIKSAEPDLIKCYGEVAITAHDARIEIYFAPLKKWYSIYAYSTGHEHFVTLFQDITERKEAEEMLKRLMAELEQKNKELEQVVYGTSHDLRAPLVNVEGFGRELQYSLKELMNALDSVEMQSDVRETVARIVQKEVPESMAYISTSIVKMASMLRGLLKLSRLGRYELKRKEIDMNALFADVVSNFEFKLKKEGIDVTVSDVPPCRGDSSQINQIFSNLLDNAINHLDPERPGIIKVSGRQENHHSVYCVEDNGIGINPEHLEKIFELFQQLDPDVEKGEGLGLTIANRIVERHHGRIWVESEPGKGSRFYVELPA